MAKYSDEFKAGLKKAYEDILPKHMTNIVNFLDEHSSWLLPNTFGYVESGGDESFCVGKLPLSDLIIDQDYELILPLWDVFADYGDGFDERSLDRALPYMKKVIMFVKDHIRSVGLDENDYHVEEAEKRKKYGPKDKTDLSELVHDSDFEALFVEHPTKHEFNFGGNYI